MSESNTFDQGDEAEIKKLLQGRRIVSVEFGSYDFGVYRKASGMMRLDDGTTIYVAPNEGGCACGAGDYELEKLVTVDNAISNVTLEEDKLNEYGGTRYRIHVVADAHDMDLMVVEGDDGNGYYGTGYELIVFKPAPKVDDVDA